MKKLLIISFFVVILSVCLYIIVLLPQTDSEENTTSKQKADVILHSDKELQQSPQIIEQLGGLDDFSEEKPKTSRMAKYLSSLKPFEWIEESVLSDQLIENIKLNMRLTVSTKVENAEMMSKSELLNHISRSINVAFPPLKGTEIDGYYLLSGGTAAYAINDFSSGIAVDTKNGMVYMWNLTNQ